MVTTPSALDSSLLYERLANELGEQISAGRLRPGQRLPSVRRTSSQRGVSVATVVQAYRLLENRGFLEARPQSGHYVRQHESKPNEPRAPRESSTAVRVSMDGDVVRLFRAILDTELVPLGPAVLAPALVPTERLNRALFSTARAAGNTAYAYLPPPGALVLRRQLARRSIGWGCALGPEEFVVTAGCAEALHLSLRAVTSPGDTVVVESPAYYGLLSLIESLGLRVVEVPAGPDGLDVELLERALAAHRIRAVLSVPNFNNPLGSLMTDAKKAAMVDLLARHEIPLIEDDIYGDLSHGPVRPRPAKSWDRTGSVLLCGSLSKTLAPGLRIGWVSAGRFQERIVALKLAESVAVPTLPQLTAAEFLENGGYDRHLRNLRRHVARQVEDLRQLVTEHFPEGTRLSQPRGGHLLWVELPGGTDAVALSRRALAAGISVAPGPVFSARRSRFKNFLRLNAGFPANERIQKAVKTLASLMRETRL
jgi:DNA-binding transcriptional MocR family regulator